MTKQETLTDQYRSYLASVGKSPHTIKAYSHDASAFASWCERTTGKNLAPQVVDPRDIQEYKDYPVR